MILAICSLPLMADDGLPDRDTFGPGTSTAPPAAGSKPDGMPSSATPSVNEMCKLDQKNVDFNAEIANQRRVIEAMRQAVEESKKPGASPPDINTLKAQGKAGQGVVGAGRSKPQHIQDLIATYESGFNPQNLLGIARLSNNITKIRNQLTKDRKSELGLGKDDELPKADEDAIEAMAGGRAYFLNEIARSQEFIGRLQGAIKANNAERVKLRGSMTDEERAEHLTRRNKPGACTTPPGAWANPSKTSSAGQGQSATPSSGSGTGSGNAAGATFGACPRAPGWQLPTGARCS
jgi:hypothetical protein